MSVTIQLDLPDALVNEARANGLLNSAPLGDLLATELRRLKAAAGLNDILTGIRDQPGEPMSEADIATCQTLTSRGKRGIVKPDREQ